jgi:hypothetical protein
MTTMPSKEVSKVYDPNRLLDLVVEKMKLKNDADMSRLLQVGAPVLSKIRHARAPVGARLLIRMHEVTGLELKHLRDAMGDRRTKYRLSSVQGMPEHKSAK